MSDRCVAALNAALTRAFAERDDVYLIGEDLLDPYGGAFKVSKGLSSRWPDRVITTPISEASLFGVASGMALRGLRPVLEIMFGDFLALSMDSLINQATKYWFLTGGRHSVPLVIRSVVGAGGRFGAIHSQMPVSWLMGIPGLKIVAPSTPADAKRLLQASIRDDNPVVFFEHKRLYSLKGEVPAEGPAELGRAAVVREGSDVTLVSAMRGVHDCLDAAEQLSEQGISAEVIDLRTLRPLDSETIVASVQKTSRIVVVEEGPLTGGWAGEVLALVTEQALGDLDDAWRIATPDSPIPYSPPLEDAFLPGTDRIVREILARS
jgi:pyruvate/2-oxoglutarate/acetoin dehydrogenase E1 component